MKYRIKGALQTRYPGIRIINADARVKMQGLTDLRPYDLPEIPAGVKNIALHHGFMPYYPSIADDVVAAFLLNCTG